MSLQLVNLYKLRSGIFGNLCRIVYQMIKCIVFDIIMHVCAEMLKKKKMFMKNLFEEGFEVCCLFQMECSAAQMRVKNLVSVENGLAVTGWQGLITVVEVYQGFTELFL